ncbi:MAG: J domain-containing protein [Myxococcota bacterium]
MVPTEIMALARIVGEFDYYQVLHLDRGASPKEVKHAFHASSRVFHPDANRHLEADLQRAVSEIAKVITEAYQVLRDPRRRIAYDEVLANGGPVRIRLAEARSEGGRRDTENRQGRSPQGRQYFNLAILDMKRSDWQAAARNLQTALTFEPDNESFKSELAAIREKLR